MRWLIAAPIAARVVAVLRHYGRFGGNLALNLGTFGGVFIAGGIVPRFLEFFKASGFRAAFEDKGRLKNMSMIFRCISSSMTIRVFSVPVHIYARP